METPRDDITYRLFEISEFPTFLPNTLAPLEKFWHFGAWLSDCGLKSSIRTVFTRTLRLRGLRWEPRLSLSGRYKATSQTTRNLVVYCLVA